MKKYTIGDYVMLGTFAIVGVGVVWLIVWAIQTMNDDNTLQKQQDAREQQFAQQFYTRCANIGGTAQTNYNGYVCWKGNGIAFSFPEIQQEHDSPKG